MGHTEMLLAVAGLGQEAIRERIRRLADGDWSSFSNSDRVAFAFVQKLAMGASALTDQDVRSLVEHFGTERALDVIWWSCRCHYMTCVSDAFQLQLEQANVFDGFLPTPGGR